MVCALTCGVMYLFDKQTQSLAVHRGSLKYTMQEVTMAQLLWVSCMDYRKSIAISH